SLAAREARTISLTVHAAHYFFIVGVMALQTVTGPRFKFTTLTTYAPVLETGTLITAKPEVLSVVFRMEPVGSMRISLIGRFVLDSATTEIAVVPVATFTILLNSWLAFRLLLPDVVCPGTVVGLPVEV